MTSIVRARDAADLLVLLPYQLGYHPRRSVVLVLLHERRVGMVQRLDLPPTREASEALAEQAMAVVVRERPKTVLVAAFEDDEGESRHLRRAVTGAARRLGVRIHDEVVARDGRYYEPGCRQAPAWGRPLPQPHEVPAVADFVRLGVAPLADRDALVASVVPETDLRIATLVDAELDRHDDPLELLAHRAAHRTRVWRAVLDPDPAAVPVPELPPSDLATALDTLRDKHWRDTIMAVLCPGSLPTSALDPRDVADGHVAVAACSWAHEDPDGLDRPDDGGADADEHEAADRDAVEARLVDLVRCAPSTDRSPVLTVLAGYTWWRGDGTAAVSCLEAALALEPDYRLAQLMQRLLQAGIRMSGRPARLDTPEPDLRAG